MKTKAQERDMQSTRRALTDNEVQELNPCFIDDRIKSLKHLHPKELSSENDY